MRSIGRIQAAPLRRGGMPNPAWKCGLNFKQFGNPLLLRLKKTHTHIYIYTVFIYIIALTWPKKERIWKLRTKNDMSFAKKNCSLSRSLVVHLQKVSPPPGIGTSVASPNTERSAKARSADCARCGGCPGRPSWTSKKKTGPLNKKGGKQVAFFCMI